MCASFSNKSCLFVRGPFLESPEKVLHPECRSQISNHMITELFYSLILSMNRGSLHSFKKRATGFFYFRGRETK